APPGLPDDPRDRALPPPRRGDRARGRRRAPRRADARPHGLGGRLALHRQAQPEAAARGLALSLAPGFALLGALLQPPGEAPERDGGARRRRRGERLSARRPGEPHAWLSPPP